MKLYIAEKKSLGLKIAKALGGGTLKNGYVDGGEWRVCFARGHILSQFEPEDYRPEWRQWEGSLPMTPSEWRLKPDPSTAHLLSNIKSALSNATTVVGAGDADRQGQLLIDEILDYLGWKGETKRLWLTDQSESYISKNINNLKDNHDFIGMKHKALARSRADWLIGLNATRAYTLAARKVNNEQVTLNVGRVQTATLALIADRDEVINNFVSTPFYSVKGSFFSGGECFDAKLISAEDTDNFKDKNLADKIVASLAGERESIVAYKTESTKRKKQPLCFSKSELVKQCFKDFGYDGEKVLEIAQSLYDKHSAITYPRTDCGYLPMSKHGEADQTINKLSEIDVFENITKNTNIAIVSDTFDDAKLTAHDGIIPTDEIDADLYNEFNEAEKNVFHAIVTRYLAQFYEVNLTAVTVLHLVVESRIFEAKGSVTTNEGWKVLYPQVKESKTPFIPLLERGDNVTMRSACRVDKATQPPKRFNDGNIEAAMKNIANYTDDPSAKKELRENEGIGEESTRSNIIKKLKEGGFIAVEKKCLVATRKGAGLINLVHPEIKSATKTALMERSLNKIEAGTLSVDDYIEQQVTFTKSLIDHAESVEPFLYESIIIPDGDPCSCGKGVVAKRKGEYGEFWGCSDYKNGCKVSYPSLGSKPYSEPFKCDCGGDLRLLGSKGKHSFKCFDCNKWFDCKRNKPVREKYAKKLACPHCESKLAVKISKANKEYLSCAGDNCNFAAFKNSSGFSYKDQKNKWVQM